MQFTWMKKLMEGQQIMLPMKRRSGYEQNHCNFWAFLHSLVITKQQISCVCTARPAHVYTHAHVHAHTHTHAHRQTHAHKHAHIHMYTRTPRLCYSSMATHMLNSNLQATISDAPLVQNTGPGPSDAHDGAGDGSPQS